MLRHDRAVDSGVTIRRAQIFCEGLTVMGSFVKHLHLVAAVSVAGRGPRGRLRSRRAASQLLAMVDIDACCTTCGSGADHRSCVSLALGPAIAVRRSAQHR